MRPAPRSKEELLAWVASIVKHEQDAGTYGEVRIQLKEGRIQSCKVERQHLPPKEK